MNIQICTGFASDLCLRFQLTKILVKLHAIYYTKRANYLKISLNFDAQKCFY